MKKIVLLLMGLIAISCINESLIESQENELKIIGSLTPETRTTFVEGEGIVETHWEVDDEIGLMTDDQYYLIYKATSAGKSTEFVTSGGQNLENVEGKTVYAYYPSKMTYHSTHPQKVPSNFYQHGSSVKPFLYGEGIIHNNQLNIRFKHFFSYLRLELSVEALEKKLQEYLDFSAVAGEREEYDLSKTYIMLRSEEDISISQGFINPKDGEIKNKITDKYLWFFLDEIDCSSDENYTYMIPILPQSSGTTVKLEIHFLKSTETEPTAIGTASAIFERTVKSENGLEAGKVYNWVINTDNSEEEEEEEEEDLITVYTDLLTKLYNCTNGKYWYNQNNWLTDVPVNEWEGVYLSMDQTHNHSIWLTYNNLEGPYPEILADLWDRNADISISGNHLYGEIPSKLKNNSKWKYYGWELIKQWSYRDPVIQEYNLYSPDVQINNFLDNNISEINIYDIFKENELTQIIKGYNDTYDYKIDLSYILNEICADRINIHLDYESKGLKTLIFVGNGTDEEFENLKESIKAIYGNLEGIYWLKGKSPISRHEHSGSYFFDKDGQLIYFANFRHIISTISDTDIKFKNLNEASHTNCKKVLKTLLGEPVEHPELTPGLYTSNDYTHDKEVIKMQEATEGRGINIIFMGDAFVDKDMETDGHYEMCMNNAMENLFSIEPMKSFRNRFNVYMIKVVSPNAECIEGAVHAIDYKYPIARQYAFDANISNPYGMPMMITVLQNPKYPYNDYRSHCYPYNDGGFVSFITQADQYGNILLHESVGHGIGRLFDEYIELGVTLDEDTKQNWDDEWNTYGRGANVDWRNDANTVKWSHFLNDSRYANEGLGIYEGAYYEKGAYKATKNSIMNTNDISSGFNAPSREAIYKHIMQLSEGESWTYDYEEFVKYDEINRNSVTRSTAKSLTEAEMKEYIRNHQPPIFIKRSSLDPIDN